MKLAKIQILDIEKKEYVLMKKKEYDKMRERIEDLEDCKLIDEAKSKSKKSYTIEDIEKKYNVKVKRYD